MRGYAVIVGAIALLSWSCQLQSAAVCSLGEDRCACLDNKQCSAGLTCVSGTCFDLGNWFAAVGGASGAGTAGLGMSVLPGGDPSAGNAGALSAGSGAAGAAVLPGVEPSAGSGAGVAAPTCAALSGDCTVAPCCEGAVCVLGICTARCKTHQDCASACCIALEANLAACFEAPACVAPAS